MEELTLTGRRGPPYVVQGRAPHASGRAISVAFAAEGVHAVGGRIDVLVNNAGIFPGSATATVDEATFDRVYAVNVKAPVFLGAAIAPAMAERGDGAIINLGSWIARLGIPVGALYRSTKGALETLTRAWAAEFGPAGVRVNAISPGVIRTPGWHGPGEHPAEVMMAGTPAGLPAPRTPSPAPRCTWPATRPPSSTARRSMSAVAGWPSPSLRAADTASGLC